jgi:hypothetical protein
VETERRFGYRLDSISGWEPVNWQSFFAQAKQVAEIETTSLELLRLFRNADAGLVRPESFKNPEISRPVKHLQESLNRKGISQADRGVLMRQFFAALRAASHADIAKFNNRPSYDYFRREVAAQDQLRTEIGKVFTNLIEEQR